MKQERQSREQRHWASITDELLSYISLTTDEDEIQMIENEDKSCLFQRLFKIFVEWFMKRKGKGRKEEKRGRKMSSMKTIP